MAAHAKGPAARSGPDCDTGDPVPPASRPAAGGRTPVAALRVDLGNGAWLVHLPRCFAGIDLNALVAEIRPRSARVRVFGVEHEQPRLVAWQADPGCTYRYSGLTLPPEPWTPGTEALRRAVSGLAERPFNSVLVTLYRDGRDGVGWHCDDEPCFGREPLIASLSLGTPRRFRLARKDGAARWSVDLGDGDLLIMGGTCQRDWRHCVPKTSRAVGPRLNLSFRVFLVRPGAPPGAGGPRAESAHQQP
jgi:alkylated DNA repair dioxygenase AlkB